MKSERYRLWKFAGTNKAHGNPLGVEEAIATKQVYSWHYEEDFFVPDEVKAHFEDLKQRGIVQEHQWNELFKFYRKAYPTLANELESAIKGEVLIDVKDILTFGTEKTISTRVASGETINHFVKSVPSIFGGSADLSHSTMTDMKEEAAYAIESFAGRNVYFGVRAHAMGAQAMGWLFMGGETFCKYILCFQ